MKAHYSCFIEFNVFCSSQLIRENVCSVTQLPNDPHISSLLLIADFVHYFVLDQCRTVEWRGADVNELDDA